MNDSLLTIVLLIVVTVLLVIDILVAITILKLLRQARNIISKVEHVVETVDSAGKTLRKLSVPVALGTFLTKLSKKLKF